MKLGEIEVVLFLTEDSAELGKKKQQSPTRSIQ